MSVYDRAAVRFRGPDADINFTATDYEDDLKHRACNEAAIECKVPIAEKNLKPACLTVLLLLVERLLPAFGRELPTIFPPGLLIILVWRTKL
ncbi:hypothetical protein AgCh_019103 [Apium graveolens]